MTPRLLSLLGAALLATAPVPVAAATLRPAATLEAPVVRLADLFDDAGPLGERVLGPAPEPGTRIVVEARQLAAIARQFGVDWRPASSADRAVLERPGKGLPREAVLAALRDALTGAGAPGDGDIELPGFIAPLVAVEAAPAVAVEQIDYDDASGRFTAMLAISGPGMPAQRQRLSGRIVEMVELPVAVRRLPVGTVLQPGDLQTARIRAAALRNDDVVRDAAEAIGLTLRRPAVPGQPLARANVARPTVVQKGAQVTLQFTTPGLSLSGQGIALEPGALGERIQVRNPISQAVLEAEVIGPGRLRVAPGSTPLRATPSRRDAILARRDTAQAVLP